MKIGDQIRARRLHLGVPVVQLAQQVGVSEQAVRYWESGRSDPSKETARRIESILDFRLDWSEGDHPIGQPDEVKSLINASDIDLFLQVSKLSSPAKLAIGQLVRLLADAEARGRVASFRDRGPAAGGEPFAEKTNNAKAKKPAPRRATR